MSRTLRVFAACGVLIGTSWASVHAQDFSPAEPAGPALTAAGLLDRGLPAAGRSQLEAMTTSWLGVPGFVTRALCASARFESVCAAAGWSLTGAPDAGWMSLGLAVGAVTEFGGVAVRGIARRDLDPLAGPEDLRGAELGGGAWLTAGPGVRIWARAPQLVTMGMGPPLPRALAVGASVEYEGLSAWFEREAPARRLDESGTHSAGVSIAVAPASLWVEGRGHPLRAGFGISIGIIAVRALGHPRLGDTITLSLSLPSHRSHG